MANKRKQKEALDYHSEGKPGKIEIRPTKPYSTQRDLALAYSPGVAEPCLKIAEDKDLAYTYTAKGNLVAVITDGTAVLGLGDIGPEASKPVMEGKALLFKIFSDIDVFDIEVDSKSVDDFVNTVKAISPTFGGINLEDIKAPECFEIERRLKEELNIPIMHDDQHGTAIISAAALLNALELAEKNIEEVRIVVNGAGASAMACIDLYMSLGAKKENILMLDSKGVIRNDREEISVYKKKYATDKDFYKLADAIENADVFLGLSRGNILSKKMVKSMAANPIVFALANPDPEIPYADAMSVRDDIIMATGRSDHPNQVNNVLGFPFIFRGALDVRATTINEEMKLAAVKAIAEIAKEPVPEEVNEAYSSKNLSFGRDFIIPKPMDPRLLISIAPAVAKAAMDSGVAQNGIEDWEKYKVELNARLGLDSKLIKNMTTRARRNQQRIVFAEADNYKVLKAAQVVKDEGIALPILLGHNDRINALKKEYGLELDGVKIIDPKADRWKGKRIEYGDVLFKKRQRRGMTQYEAQHKMQDRNYFGAMMVNQGDADAFISGITRNYPETIRPALQVIGTEEGVSKIAGMYILITKTGPVFFADTTINVNPSARDLADIAILTAKSVERLKIKPRIAMLSFANFGSTDFEPPRKVREAVGILHKEHPDLIVDGELQANFALNNELMKEKFPFSKIASS
ncbi:MAG TPA: NADP-dependent malic enzyme, partial [Marinilabiliaceae bacterium]|nr:NADP-dependent malic enzyme [Marinilabiliaceae bacterium]